MSKPKANKDTKQQKYKDLKSLLKIDETLTKGPNKQTKKYNKVKNNIPLVEDYNFSCDLLFLPLTRQNYRYLLTVVDLATDEIDFEEIKDKEPKTIVDAMKKIFAREHLNMPYASMKSDNGNEFKGVFHKYMIDNKVLHKTSLTGRHISVANIEAVNRLLAKYLNGYMNSKEQETGKVYKEWVDILPILRKKLNKIRKRKLPKNPNYKRDFEVKQKPKFKEGDMVHRALDNPRNTLNEKQSGSVFREGDLKFDPVPLKIKSVLYYGANDGNNYRYLLDGINNASFAEWQLKISDIIEEPVVEIKAILDRNYNRKEKKYFYKIWMYGETKAKAGFYERSQLVKDIGLNAVKELDSIYEDLKKEQAKKKKK